MEVELDPSLIKQFEQIKKRQPKLYQKIQKQLQLFRTDPYYPSLRNHKLEGHLKNSFSITIEDNFRLIYIAEEDMAYFYLAGTHDQVYKLEL